MVTADFKYNGMLVIAMTNIKKHTMEFILEEIGEVIKVNGKEFPTSFIPLFCITVLRLMSIIFMM